MIHVAGCNRYSDVMLWSFRIYSNYFINIFFTTKAFEVKCLVGVLGGKGVSSYRFRDYY